MPQFIDGEPTQEEWEFINEFERPRVEMEKSMQSKRIEVRVSKYMAERIKAEAIVLGMSLNAYVVKLLAYRKHARKAFVDQEIIAGER
jgi:predicted HicB family RNase H-like nuclease